MVREMSQTIADLYAAHHSTIFGYCRRYLVSYHDAEDACAETFARIAATGLARFDGAFPLAYLRTISRNICLDKIAQYQSRSAMPLFFPKPEDDPVFEAVWIRSRFGEIKPRYAAALLSGQGDYVLQHRARRALPPRQHRRRGEGHEKHGPRSARARKTQAIPA